MKPFEKGFTLPKPLDDKMRGFAPVNIRAARVVIALAAALLVLAAVIQSGKPWHGEDHGYGYPWEHSLAEWAEITARDKEQPRLCATYNWVNYLDGKRRWEQMAWVNVPCQ